MFLKEIGKIVIQENICLRHNVSVTISSFATTVTLFVATLIKTATRSGGLNLDTVQVIFIVLSILKH